MGHPLGNVKTAEVRNKVNGKEARFSEAEARQLQEALHDLGQRLSSIILI